MQKYEVYLDGTLVPELIACEVGDPGWVQFHPKGPDGWPIVDKSGNFPRLIIETHYGRVVMVPVPFTFVSAVFYDPQLDKSGVAVTTRDGNYGYYETEFLRTEAEVEAFIDHIRKEARKAGMTVNGG